MGYIYIQYHSYSDSLEIAYFSKMWHHLVSGLESSNSISSSSFSFFKKIYFLWISSRKYNLFPWSLWSSWLHRYFFVVVVNLPCQKTIKDAVTFAFVIWNRDMSFVDTQNWMPLGSHLVSFYECRSHHGGLSLMTSSKFNYLPMVPFPNILIHQLGHQHVNFREIYTFNL